MGCFLLLELLWGNFVDSGFSGRVVGLLNDFVQFSRQICAFKEFNR